MSEQTTQPVEVEEARPADVPARPRAAKADGEDTRYGLDQWVQQAEELGVQPWDVEAVMRDAGKDAIGRAELVRRLEAHGRRPVGADAQKEE